MKFKILLFFLLFSLLTIIIGGYSVHSYFDYRAEKLAKGYPVWSKEKDRYILVNEKPKTWVHLNEISKPGKWAIILSEDWAFYQHNGIDTNQLKIVIEESYEEGKFVRGASTITQQLVKNTLLSNEKSLWRKLKEIVLALMIETKMSKDQILEKYLNLIELGNDLYGIGPASEFYFFKKPKDLTPKEAAFLAMLLPSPKKYSQSYRNKKLTEFAKEQVEAILGKMKQAKVITDEEYELEMKRNLAFEKAPLLDSLIEEIKEAAQDGIDAIKKSMDQDTSNSPEVNDDLMDIQFYE